MFKLDLEKTEGWEIKLPISAGSSKKQDFQKNIYFCFIDYAKDLIVWMTISCEKFLKKWKYQTTLPASWETCMQVKKQQLEPDMEQWTGSKLGKKSKLYIVMSPCLFILYAEYIIQNSRLDEA